MELAGLGKEVFDRGLRLYCSQNPNADICLEHGTTPFWDSIEDLIANQQCAGWESFAFGAVGGWIGAIIREDCECCCKKKVGFDNGDI